MNDFYRVNSVNPSATKRDEKDVKKKWQDIQSVAKKKEAARIRSLTATGGGPAQDENLKTWEQHVSNSRAFYTARNTI